MQKKFFLEFDLINQSGLESEVTNYFTFASDFIIFFVF